MAENGTICRCGASLAVNAVEAKLVLMRDPYGITNPVVSATCSKCGFTAMQRVPRPFKPLTDKEQAEMIAQWRRQ